MENRSKSHFCVCSARRHDARLPSINLLSNQYVEHILYNPIVAVHNQPLYPEAASYPFLIPIFVENSHYLNAMSLVPGVELYTIFLGNLHAFFISSTFTPSGPIHRPLGAK